MTPTYTILRQYKIDRGWLFEVFADTAAGFADFLAEHDGLAPGTKVEIAEQKITLRLLNSGEWELYASDSTNANPDQIDEIIIGGILEASNTNPEEMDEIVAENILESALGDDELVADLVEVVRTEGITPPTEEPTTTEEDAA